MNASSPTVETSGPRCAIADAQRSQGESYGTDLSIRDAAILCGIFGTGRSGTTWLGVIFNAHPRVAYRFEPFGRGKAHPHLSAYLQRMRDGTFADEDIDGLYRELVRADPLTDKPPFFFKSGQPRTYKSTLWGAARAIPILRPLYARLYTPPDGRCVVFKEMTREPVLRCLLACGTVPTVYLARHPCATVASLVRGQSAGKMPIGRLGVLPSLLRKHDPALYDRFGPQLDEMNAFERNALLWRIDVETGVAAIKEAGRGVLLTYEQLCDDASAHVARICEEFRLDFTPEMRQFIDALYAGRRPDACGPVRFSDSYFSVLRNPRRQRDKWKESILPEDRRKVERLVGDSPAFEACAELGDW